MMTCKNIRRAALVAGALIALAAAVVVAHVTHHLDWTTLPVIGPQGIQLGSLHLFIH